jgi:hypothetical protein
VTGVILGLLGDFWPWLVAAGGAIAALVAAFVSGDNRRKQKEKYKDAKAHIETERKTREAITPDTDVDAARKRMRDRANKP